MPIAAVAKEYGRLMGLYYDTSLNWRRLLDGPDGVRWTTYRQEHLSLVNGIEEIWLKYPDERVAFETKLKLSIKF
jgi:hypothetical protein